MRHKTSTNMTSPTLLTTIALLCLLATPLAAGAADDQPSPDSTTPTHCGTCWCAAGNGTCPSWQPKTYTASFVAALAKQTPANPFTIDCNPYTDSSCKTSPPQTLVDNEEAVCARLYRGTNSTTPNCTEYMMVTYPTRAAAEAAGAFVTHERACGLCSSAQDLAAYMQHPDMTKPGKECAIVGILKEEWGIECFEKLGFTTPCATIWAYDALFDEKHCGGICVKDLFKPYNGPPPFCPINACLECDETQAGPVFKAYAGNTRRRAGLQSSIARPCTSVANIVHSDPCEPSPVKSHTVFP